MNKHQKKALVLFAKDPAPGKVKTRLSGLLDEDTILKLYIHFLAAGFKMLASVKGADPVIAVAPPIASDFFQANPSAKSFEIFSQEGADLGQRMRQAILKCFDNGYERTVIIGADSPNLPVEYIQRALDSEEPLTLGPSVDGGYYLIGMGPKLIDVFDNVQWGTETALAETGANARKKGYGVELLPVWYDIDRPEDLRYLKTHMELSGGNDETAKSLLEFLETLELKQTQ